MAFSNIDATWVAEVAGSPEYTDVELRRADTAGFAGAGDTADPLKVRGGIVLHASNSLAVTVDGSDVVTLQAGAVAIPGNDTAGGGVYRTALGTAATETLAARDATNPRIDLVVFEMISGGTQARPRIIAGTPSGSPGVETLPDRAVELARITVPAVGGGAATVDSSRRMYATAPGGRLAVASSAALPTAAVMHERAIAMDTGVEYTWDGSAWSSGAWSSYSCTWTAVTTNPSIGNGSIVARYRQVGKTVHYRIKVVMGSTTTYGSGEYRFSLPVTPVETTFYAPIGTGFCRDDSASSKYPRLAGVATSTTVNLSDMSGAPITSTVPFTFANDDIIIIAGTYEAA